MMASELVWLPALGWAALAVVVGVVAFYVAAVLLALAASVGVDALHVRGWWFRPDTRAWWAAYYVLVFACYLAAPGWVGWTTATAVLG